MAWAQWDATYEFVTTARLNDFKTCVIATGPVSTTEPATDSYQSSPSITIRPYSCCLSSSNTTGNRCLLSQASIPAARLAVGTMAMQSYWTRHCFRHGAHFHQLSRRKLELKRLASRTWPGRNRRGAGHACRTLVNELASFTPFQVRIKSQSLET